LDIIEFIHTPPYKDKVFLHEKYVQEGLSLAQISSQICSSKEAVRKGLVRAGIQLRESHQPHGRSAQVRYGERRVKDKPQPHMAEKRVIKTIMDMRAQGMSLRQIAQFLSQIGVPTKCRGKSWHPEMIKRILVNETSEAATLVLSRTPSAPPESAQG
jgi:IS30 family transposase